MPEETEAEEAGESKGGTSWIVVVIVMLVGLAAGAGGAYFLLGSQSETMAATMEPEVPEVDPGTEFKERLVALEPFVVNVAGEGFPRFLKLKIELEADSAETRQELEARTPQVRDITILLLASKRMPDVSEFEGRALLKDDLRDRINEILGQGEVASVLFTEFVVQ